MPFIPPLTMAGADPGSFGPAPYSAGRLLHSERNGQLIFSMWKRPSRTGSTELAIFKSFARGNFRIGEGARRDEFHGGMRSDLKILCHSQVRPKIG